MSPPSDATEEKCQSINEYDEISITKRINRSASLHVTSILCQAANDVNTRLSYPAGNSALRKNSFHSNKQDEGFIPRGLCLCSAGSTSHLIYLYARVHTVQPCGRIPSIVLSWTNKQDERFIPRGLCLCSAGSTSRLIYLSTRVHTVT